MGGRGAYSASSRSFSTGDSYTDKIVSSSLKKHKAVEANTKLQQKTAQKYLSGSGNKPMGLFEHTVKAMVQQHKQNLKDVANFKVDVVRREKAIAKEEKILQQYSKDVRMKTNVRGQSVTSNSARYEKQAKKVSMLNQSLTNAYSEMRLKEKAIKKYKESISEKIDREARKAIMAEKYRKKKK